MVKSDDITSLLSSMNINPSDGMPMDSAIWSDWRNAVQKTLNDSSENRSS